MEFRNIELPAELMPAEEMIELAEEQDEFYRKIYKQLRKDNSNATASDVIEILAKIRVEQISPMIGANLRDYDKEVLMSVIERHIARRVFVG